MWKTKYHSLFGTKIEYKSKTERESQLQHIISFAEMIIAETDPNNTNGDSLIPVVRLLSDHINHERLLTTISPDGSQTADYRFSLFQLLLGNYPVSDRSIRIEDGEALLNDRFSTEALFKYLYYIETQSIQKYRSVIRLGKDPIITSIWNGSRLASSLAAIGMPDNPWIEDINNHHFLLWLPMGITLVNGGNHSIATGMLKCEGKLKAGINTKNPILDVSYIYTKMRFDGTYYRRTLDQSIIGKANDFAFGCIYEIGRLALRHNISLVNDIEEQDPNFSCPVESV